MWVNVVFVACVFYPCELMYQFIMDKFYYFQFDVFMSVILLLMVSALAASKKYYIDRGERHADDFHRKDLMLTKKLYRLMTLMVPTHVAQPLITHPQTAI